MGQTCGRSSAVERLLAKEKVMGSNPTARSIYFHGVVAKWQGKGLQNPDHGFKSRRRLSELLFGAALLVTPPLHEINHTRKNNNRDDDPLINCIKGAIAWFANGYLLRSSLIAPKVLILNSHSDPTSNWLYSEKSSGVYVYVSPSALKVT
jgi:hypothetical protein